jgi:hypothetical protein
MVPMVDVVNNELSQASGSNIKGDKWKSDATHRFAIPVK